ncbi:hypothetical protein STEG23_025887, partial [Scotinomys teguina]
MLGSEELVSLDCVKLAMKVTKTDINTENALLFYQGVVKLFITALMGISRCEEQLQLSTTVNSRLDVTETAYNDNLLPK